MSPRPEHTFYFPQWLLQRPQPLGHTDDKNKIEPASFKRKILYVGNLQRHSLCQPRLLGPNPRRQIISGTASTASTEKPRSASATVVRPCAHPTSSTRDPAGSASLSTRERATV